jgi:protoporphyrinogen oxidase
MRVSNNFMKNDEYKIIIIGAGPAGLTAAWEAEKHGVKTLILESDKKVGGISRTVEKNGWKFDIGGHRFFTKVDEVYQIWDEILDKDEFLLRPRMSRIYYNNKFYDYPLKAFNALFNLGIFEAIRCVASYVYVRLRPPKNQENFENWVAARFGWRLYNIFFKTYTEKVWGVPATEIGADWASQRIKNLSLGKAIINAVFRKNSGEVITTLINEFKYPKFGPGMMWDKAYEVLEKKGHQILLNSRVAQISKDQDMYIITLSNGKSYKSEFILSSMPLAHLPKTVEPNPEQIVKNAGENLKFRDFLSVAIVVDEKDAFPDNWIYIHDPNVNVGRVQNYGSWSPYMVKDNKTCLGLEYFVNKGDNLWEMKDSDLIKLGIEELKILKLIKTEESLEGYVVRMPKAYPVYDLNYSSNIEHISNWLTDQHPKIFPIGRNGMHRYNNQDHSMMTAVKSIRNILAGENNDIWSINVEDDYLEEPSTGRSAPTIG